MQRTGITLIGLSLYICLKPAGVEGNSLHIVLLGWTCIEESKYPNVK